MKFLIQKINGKIVHDFSFTLLESINFKNWFEHSEKIKVKFLNYDTEIPEPDDIYPIPFKPCHKGYVPIGTVEFVTEFLEHFYGFTPNPINVPEELFHYAGRKIFNGTEKDLKDKIFVKSNERIKSTSGIFNEKESIKLPVGNYQFSEVIGIDSEWRAFVYENKLVGLQNYAGEFILFPNVDTIKGMIKMYKSAPIAYTLDVGINDDSGTFVIELHDFFAIGLYGFNQPILVNMFYRWFKEYLKLNSK